MRRDRVLTGVLMMVGFCATAPLIDVSSKLASETLPVGQITAARFMGQAVLMLPVVLWTGGALLPSRRVLPLMALRAALLIASTFTFVSAVKVMPLADALAIVFVEPFLLLLAGHLLLGETVGPRRLLACLAGFAGALLVIQPGLAAFGAVALWPLATAVAFAGYMLVTRALAPLSEPVAMQFHTALLALPVLLPLLWAFEGTGHPGFDPAMPAGSGWLWLAGVGLAATVSHLLITHALRLAPSATLAPLQYLELVTAVALGYAIWGDLPGPLTWAGIVLIAGSGLYVLGRERALARQSA